MAETDADTSREARLMEAWDLSQLLMSLSQHAFADFVAIVEPLGLPSHLARALLLLDRPAPMRDLAEHLACDPSYVTSLADQLEDRGLARRTPADDRRYKLLALTDDGEALKARITDAVASRSMFLLRLDDRERATLAPLLEKLLDRSAGAAD